MSEPFIAEIRIFAGNFAPRGWTFCDGQLLPIAQFTAVFALVGTIYGGDGRTSFGVPDMKGRVPVHWGTGPGLSRIQLGQKSGAATHTLTSGQMLSHGHATVASSAAATTGTPTESTLPAATEAPNYGPASDLEPMADAAGGGQAHPNEQPYLVLNFIFALEGLFPSRS